MLSEGKIVLQKATQLSAKSFEFAEQDASELIYSGTAKQAILTANRKSICGDITVYYSDDEGKTWSTKAPVNAGTYQVKIDATGSETFQGVNGLTRNSWVFTIVPKELNVSVEDIIIEKGQPIPSLNVKVTGFVDGESEADLSDFVKPVATVNGTVDTQDTSLTQLNVTYSGGNATGNYTFLPTTTANITIREGSEGGDPDPVNPGGNPSSGTPGGNSGSVSTGGDADGTKVKTTTETKADGTKVEKTIETKEDGTKIEKINETKLDGTNTQKTIITDTNNKTSITVKVTKNEAGKVKKATATVTQQGKTLTSGTKTTLLESIGNQIKEAANTNSVTVSFKVMDDTGKVKYIVKANLNDLTAGKKLAIFKQDAKTGELILVNSKSYKVTDSGNVSVTMNQKATYQLLNQTDAKAAMKAIIKTVKLKTNKQSVKVGEKISVVFSKNLNTNNVKTIAYTSSKKTIATVNNNGVITAKKQGTAMITVKVTLKNATKKIVKMKVTVK